MCGLWQATAVMGAANVLSGALQGQAEQDALEYQAALSRNAAIAADYQAQDAIERGNTEVSDYRTEARARLGQQIAAQAASGLDITASGSAQNSFIDEMALADTDIQRIRLNAAREAWGYETQASAARASAANYRAAASNTGAFKGAVGSLLGTGAQVAPLFAAGRNER